MKLAINGGKPVRTKYFNPQLSYNNNEEIAIKRFFDKPDNILSGYRGNFSSAFWGGQQVRKFEQAFGSLLNQGALAVNSCTSALQIACGAIGLEPGDEVIVTPWSMVCSATAPLLYGAIPIFADIEKDYFCLDPESVRRRITPRTKAIIAVDLFGQPFNPEIIEIAEFNGLMIIEDAAQAIGSTLNGHQAGTLGDIGCFSFTQGKHLTAGEGGVITTENYNLYMKAALLRNHADAVTNEFDDFDGYEDLSMCGFNMRITELQAVILQEQLKKLGWFITQRQINAELLYKYICELPMITPAEVREDCTHSYYCQAFHYDKEKCDGIHRDTFINAVKAELMPDEQRIDRGVPIGCGYIKPLYKMPVFQNYYHWAFRHSEGIRIPKYKELSLPNVEHLQNEELFISLYHGLDLRRKDLYDIKDAFLKVWENRSELL